MEQKAFEMALAFQRGEEKGFDFFFNQYYAALSYKGYKIVKDAELSLDFTQIAFMRIWQNHEMFNHPKQIVSWLYTTVINECRKHFQERDRRWSGLFIDTDTIFNIKIEDRQEVEIEIVRKLHTYVKNLPAGCRNIMEMLFFKEMSISEVSKKIGIAETTVKNQKSRGLKLLRKMFGYSEEQFKDTIVKREMKMLLSTQKERYFGVRWGYYSHGKLRAQKVLAQKYLSDEDNPFKP